MSEGGLVQAAAILAAGVLGLLAALGLRRLAARWRTLEARAAAADDLAAEMHEVQTRLLRGIEAEQERDRLFNLSLDLLAVGGFDGFLQQLNPAWVRVLGWSRDDLMGRPVLDFVHAEDRPAVEVAFRRLAEGEPRRRARMPLRLPRRQPPLALVEFVPLRGPAAHLLGGARHHRRQGRRAAAAGKPGAPAGPGQPALPGGGPGAAPPGRSDPRRSGPAAVRPAGAGDPAEVSRRSWATSPRWWPASWRSWTRPWSRPAP